MLVLYFSKGFFPLAIFFAGCVPGVPPSIFLPSLAVLIAVPPSEVLGFPTPDIRNNYLNLEIVTLLRQRVIKYCICANTETPCYGQWVLQLLAQVALRNLFFKRQHPTHSYKMYQNYAILNYSTVYGCVQDLQNYDMLKMQDTSRK